MNQQLIIESGVNDSQLIIIKAWLRFKRLFTGPGPVSDGDEFSGSNWLPHRNSVFNHGPSRDHSGRGRR